MISTQKIYAGLVTLKKVVTTLSATVSGLLTGLLSTPNTWSAKQTFSAFTVLGDATVKVKKLSGTTDALASGVANVAHGVDATKIISIGCLVASGGSLYPPNALLAADSYTFTADATNVIVTNGALATTILNSPITITIIYEE